MASPVMYGWLFRMETFVLRRVSWIGASDQVGGKFRVTCVGIAVLLYSFVAVSPAKYW